MPALHVPGVRSKGMNTRSAVSRCCLLCLSLGLSLLMTSAPAFAECASGEELSCKNPTQSVLDTHWQSVDQYGSFEAAVDAIGAATKTLIISAPQTVQASKSIPATLALMFIGEGRLDPGPGITLTINSAADGWPLRQIFGHAGKIVFGSPSPVSVLYPQWWGAKDGTDSTVAFQAAFAALQGAPTQARWTYGTRSRTLHIPAGRYTISAKQTFRFSRRHAGAVIRGDGALSTLIDYTDNAAGGNYLFYHDRTVDGQAIDFTIKDLAVFGPGPTSSAGFLYVSSGTEPRGGSGQVIIDNVRISNFYEGLVLEGADADNDKYLVMRFDAREVMRHVTINNSQSMAHTFFHCAMTHPTTAPADAAIFRMMRGGWVNVYGGTYVMAGESSLVHFPAGASSTLQPIRFFGISTELHNDSMLVKDDNPSGNHELVVFRDCKLMTTSGALERPICKIQDGTIVEIYGGVVRGSFALIASDAAHVNGRPQLLMEGIAWIKGRVMESYTSPVKRPLVRIANVLLHSFASQADPPRLDQETGWGTGSAGQTRARREKVYYLAAPSAGQEEFVLPSASSPAGGTVSVTIPPGSDIVRIRLVCFDNQEGTDGVWTVTNGDGSRNYITKQYSRTAARRFIEEALDTILLDLKEVSRQDAIVKVTAVGFSHSHKGYVEITYR